MRKLKNQPKRVGGWLFRKIPWYGKILVPFVLVAGALYAFQSVAGWLGWL